MATIQTAPQGSDSRVPVTPRSVVILGGGEHARVVADAALSRPDLWRIAGYTDPSGERPMADVGLKRLGDDRALAGRLAAMPAADRPALVLGFGQALDDRRRATTTFREDVQWATIVHATAWVSPSATVEPGAVVLAGAIVNAGAHVGAHVIVNTSAVVEHDVTVGAFSHLGPGAIVGGGTDIGEDAHVGLGAVVRDHLTIGHRVVVGMGAVVVADVADGLTVMGVPARERGSPDG